MTACGHRRHIASIVSFELWPRRSPESAEALEAALEELGVLGPAFVKITYGAGGGRASARTTSSCGWSTPRCSRSPTSPAPPRPRRAGRADDPLPPGGRRQPAGLHGDPPLSATAELPEGDLRYAVERVALARGLGFPGVGVALHPEGHPAAASRAADLRRRAAELREADLGPDPVFHRSEDYFVLVEELRTRGADAPVVPGLMAITNLRQLRRMASMSGTDVPVALAERLHAVADRPDEVRRIGVEHATGPSHALLDGGRQAALLHDENGRRRPWRSAPTWAGTP